MCGITGFIDYQKSITETDLLNASAIIRHRGSNGNGHFFEIKDKYQLGLAHERLATIDTSTNATQPFTSSCGHYTIVFNGTIYNYLELRSILIKYGVTFTTLSDTEVLLECYRKWGSELFEKIDGAFAIIILDRKKKQLFVARDTIGVKPLYYYRNNSFFAFSSEIKGLLKFPISKKINRQALNGYFRCGYLKEEETFFENIYNFKPQHYLLIDINSGNFIEKQFSPYKEKDIYVPEDEPSILLKLEELITDSILKRNVSDVNVGVPLSGGYDSSTVAAILQKNQTKKLKTFTVGFKNKKLDEAPYARAIAKHLGTHHHEYYIEDNDAISTLELLPSIFDEPMGDSGTIPLAFLMKKIADQNIKVILGAEGGDELFAGYNSYQQAFWLNKKRTQIPKFLHSFIFSVYKHKKNKLEEAFNANNLLETFEIVNSAYSYKEISALFNKESISPITPIPLNGNSLNDLLKYDLENYLPNDLLLKSDRTAMYHGIDNRDALLSTNLIQYVEKLPDKWKIRDNISKYLLKKTTHNYIPETLLIREKRGFSIPLSEWMSTIYQPYIEEYLSLAQLDKHRFFNIVEVFKIKNRFNAYKQASDARKLWLLLQFQMWYNQWFD